MSGNSRSATHCKNVDRFNDSAPSTAILSMSLGLCRDGLIDERQTEDKEKEEQYSCSLLYTATIAGFV